MTSEERNYSLMLAIFSVAAAMVGVCLTGIGLFQVVSSVRKVGSLVDELLAANAAIFLLCCFFSFLALRHAGQPRRQWLNKVADWLFFTGLVVMAVTSGLITLAFV